MDKGQVCVDFLISITIIAFGIVVLLSQIPMLFAPFQTVATDIQPVAYRTSMILVEDGGIYDKEGNITSRWEDPEGTGWTYSQNKNLTNYHANVKRIGLAMPAPPGFSSEDVVSNNLSRNKIEALQDWWKDGNSTREGNSSEITNKLGLSVTYNTIPLNYRYNISLRAFDESLIRNITSNEPLLQLGDPLPVSSVTIEKIERIVAIDKTTDLGNYVGIGDVQCAKLVVYIWR